MNFLAHIYLSGTNQKVIIGNFIGDFIKGKAYEHLDPDLQKGILLHRAIDTYTDEHPVVTVSKKRLRPKYHHYAPVIVDVFYDHFLANLWDKFHERDLLDFTESFYSLAKEYVEVIPDRANHMLFYMSRDNWLYNYQFVEGINRALSGMSRRTSFKSKMEQAASDLKTDYDLYQSEFLKFFPDLVKFSQSYLNES